MTALPVPCGVCGDPLDLALPRAGFFTHPCCEPGEISEEWPPETAGDPGTLPAAIDNLDNRSVTI